MGGKRSFRRRRRSIRHTSRRRDTARHKSTRKSKRKSRRQSRRHRPIRHRRQRQNGGEAHSSYNHTWLSSDAETGEMAKENKVQDKKPGEMGKYDGKDADSKLLGRKTKRQTLLYTTNFLEKDGEKPRTTILYRSGKSCPIKSIDSVPDTGLGGHVTYVVWVRHCHSCSNAAGEGLDVITNPMAKMREPLCTALGSRQALDAGFYLNELVTGYLRENGLPPACCLRFYSSFLPRTFQTAKLMAASYADETKGSQCSFGKRTVKRLCNVSEETKGYEKAADIVRPDGRGSQSITTRTKSKQHAKYLDDNIGADFAIEDDAEACGSEKIAGSGIDKLACDYGDFLQKVLPTLNSDTDKCLSQTRFNVIVSHGGYIRHCVLQSTRKHPANTQMYLVKYTHPADHQNEFPIHAEVLQTITIPGMANFEENTGLPKHKQDLYEAAKKVNTDCSYTYHGTIAPKNNSKTEVPKPLYGDAGFPIPL